MTIIMDIENTSDSIIRNNQFMKPTAFEL